MRYRYTFCITFVIVIRYVIALTPLNVTVFGTLTIKKKPFHFILSLNSQGLKLLFLGRFGEMTVRIMHTKQNKKFVMLKNNTK